MNPFVVVHFPHLVVGRYMTARLLGRLTP